MVIKNHYLYVHKSDMRLLRFILRIVTSGEVLKHLVAKLISITRVNKKIPVRSEVNYPPSRSTGDAFCLPWKTGSVGKGKEISLIFLHSLKIHLMRDY